MLVFGLAVKQRYLEKDKAVLTRMDLIRCNRENEVEKLTRTPIFRELSRHSS